MGLRQLKPQLAGLLVIAGEESCLSRTMVRMLAPDRARVGIICMGVL